MIDVVDKKQMYDKAIMGKRKCFEIILYRCF